MKTIILIFSIILFSCEDEKILPKNNDVGNKETRVRINRNRKILERVDSINRCGTTVIKGN